MLMTWTPLTANVFGVIPLPFDGTIAAVVTFLILLLVFGRAVFGRPGATIAIALVLGAMQAALWWFAPWSARAYASFVGLPLRDSLGPHAPELPSNIPMFMIGSPWRSRAYCCSALVGAGPCAGPRRSAVRLAA